MNATVELAAKDPVVAQVIHERTIELEQIFTELLQQGAELGEFRKSINPTDSARFLVSSLFGIYIAAKVFAHDSNVEKRVEHLVQTILSTLE